MCVPTQILPVSAVSQCTKDSPSRVWWSEDGRSREKGLSFCSPEKKTLVLPSVNPIVFYSRDPVSLFQYTRFSVGETDTEGFPLSPDVPFPCTGDLGV